MLRSRVLETVFGFLSSYGHVCEDLMTGLAVAVTNTLSLTNMSAINSSVAPGLEIFQPARQGRPKMIFNMLVIITKL